MEVSSSSDSRSLPSRAVTSPESRSSPGSARFSAMSERT